VLNDIPIDAPSRPGISGIGAAFKGQRLSEERLSLLLGKLRWDGLGLFLSSLIVSILLFQQINPLHYLFLFFVIDVFGYYPALIERYFSRNDRQPAPLYAVYNLFHSNCGGLLIAMVYLASGGDAVNLLALTLHYGIDRGFLGNYLKSPGERI
jgi:hypothetical protein